MDTSQFVYCPISGTLTTSGIVNGDSEPQFRATRPTGFLHFTAGEMEAQANKVMCPIFM